MHYFIDGYNLMFRVLRAGSDLQKQREFIIDDLQKKIQKVGLDATLVFDAQYQSGESSRSHLKHLEICFTHQGLSADEYILQRLKKVEFPRRYLVVTSDKKLAWLARRLGAQTETVEEFLRQLNNRYKNKLKAPREAKLKKAAAPKQKPTPFAQKVSSEESFDYYLDQFEKEFQETISREPILPKKEEKTPKKKNKIKKFKREAGLSDMDYWLKAFERPLENDNTKTH